MAIKDEERTPLPPYIPFKTFSSFIQRLKETTVPERIDLSLLRNYSGSAARQLIATLKYLRLIEDGGTTTETLTKLVNSYDTPQWKEVLHDSMFEAYDPLLNQLNLVTATPAQLEEKFRAKGADGQMLQKCINFFIAAMINAGAMLSPHIINRPRAKPDKNRPRAKKSKRSIGDEEEAEEDEIEEAGGPSGAGTAKFAFPIPDKTTARLRLPSDLSEDDWEMIDAMIRAYVKRKAGK